MSTIINMTPHDVMLCNKDGKVTKTFPSAGVIRLSMTTEQVTIVDGVPLSHTSFGRPEGLPEEKTGIYYIVSQLVLSACKDRNDLLVPAEMVRDNKGRIVGCQSLGLAHNTLVL